MKKVIGFLVIALLVFFVVTQPVAAANSLQSIGATLYDAAQSITTFFQRVV